MKIIINNKNINIHVKYKYYNNNNKFNKLIKMNILKNLQ